MQVSANKFDGKGKCYLTFKYKKLIFIILVKFAKLVGSPELHVKVGSTISLACVVNHQVPAIQWFATQHVNFEICSKPFFFK